MPEQILNNYEAAKELDSFVIMYISPLDKRFQEAKKILDDPNYQWKENDREKALKTYKRIEADLINFTSLKNKFKKLIEQHEKIGSRLCDLYYKWQENIAYEGKQPLEMMESQAEMLQEIFTEIYGFVEIFKIDNLKAPNNEQ